MMMLKKLCFFSLGCCAIALVNVGYAACDPRAPQVNPNVQLPARRMVRGEQFKANLGLLSSDAIGNGLFLTQNLWPAVGINYSGMVGTGLSLHAYMSDDQTPCDVNHLCYLWMQGVVSKTANSTVAKLQAYGKYFGPCQDQIQTQPIIIVSQH